GSLRDLPGAARLQPAREPLAKQYKLSFDELYTKNTATTENAAAAPKSGIPSTSPTPQGLILR
ncbi:hypothetical protein ODJ71_31080, partial [Pseudomonas aeruginosa]|uniref:hypothetical protein n=1 Tax=Pseudomonas aeruginosa TaxID=287 RepID=UPI002D1EE311